MDNIITRGESRKIKDRQRKAAKRNDDLFRKSENEKLKKRVANLREDGDYIRASNSMRNNHRKQKKIIEYNNATANSEVPLYVFELDNEFEKTLTQSIQKLKKMLWLNFVIKVSMQDIELFILKASIFLTNSSFEIDFNY
ncbi:1138_t:CDS:2 [Dentiscutata erythropus]|uniref:1138_t:CDS:1 n=1 Tax=Dentiscutata erythropus TaxID=1348616 RepID=A0A9N9FVF3_9GLOM|nr:1138_t:CDS:2 [Dentiscutata erythropus]